MTPTTNNIGSRISRRNSRRKPRRNRVEISFENREFLFIFGHFWTEKFPPKIQDKNLCSERACCSSQLIPETEPVKQKIGVDLLINTKTEIQKSPQKQRNIGPDVLALCHPLISRCFSPLRHRHLSQQY